MQEINYIKYKEQLTKLVFLNHWTPNILCSTIKLMIYYIAYWILYFMLYIELCAI